MCSAKVREKIQDRGKCGMQNQKKKKKKERKGIPRKGEKREPRKQPCNQSRWEWGSCPLEKCHHEKMKPIKSLMHVLRDWHLCQRVLERINDRHYKKLNTSKRETIPDISNSYERKKMQSYKTQL